MHSIISWDRKRYFIGVPSYWVQRSADFALRIAEIQRKVDYAAAASAVAGGQDRIARIAEVGMCLFCSVDPETLAWEIDIGGDPGYDLISNNIKIDVKASENKRAKYVLWPPLQVPRFDGKDFDVLVLIRVRGDCCDIAGAVSKERFKNNCDRQNPKFHQGTWCMHEEQLRNAGGLR